jgi:16S rRNA (guanine527-N7)-methyltransferase
MDPHNEQQLHRLVEIFLAENAHINLSAHRTAEACWDGNVRDSLPYLDIHPRLEREGAPIRSIIDVGTGGGFPALPLAMLLPDVTVTAMDSTRKKIDAVGRMAEALALKNLRIAVGRAEELGRNANMREKFDVVLARAVAALPTLLEYCSPFVRPGGWIVLWKSMDIGEELQASERAQSELHCPFSFLHPYDIGGTWGQRQLLVFHKETRLSPQYPRKTGVPGKEPL